MGSAVGQRGAGQKGRFMAARGQFLQHCSAIWLVRKTWELPHSRAEVCGFLQGWGDTREEGTADTKGKNGRLYCKGLAGSRCAG
jgi:hypothetical protein